MANSCREDWFFELTVCGQNKILQSLSNLQSVIICIQPSPFYVITRMTRIGYTFKRRYPSSNFPRFGFSKPVNYRIESILLFSLRIWASITYCLYLSVCLTVNFFSIQLKGQFWPMSWTANMLVYISKVPKNN